MEKEKKKNTRLVHPRDYHSLPPQRVSITNDSDRYDVQGKNKPEIAAWQPSWWIGCKNNFHRGGYQCDENVSRKYRREGRGNRGRKAANSSLISWRGVNSGLMKAASRHQKAWGPSYKKERRFSIKYVNPAGRIRFSNRLFASERGRWLSCSPYFSRERGNWRETQQFPIRLEITSMIGSDRRELLPGRNYTGTIAREIH